MVGQVQSMFASAQALAFCIFCCRADINNGLIGFNVPLPYVHRLRLISVFLAAARPHASETHDPVAHAMSWVEPAYPEYLRQGWTFRRRHLFQVLTRVTIRDNQGPFGCHECSCLIRIRRRGSD